MKQYIDKSVVAAEIEKRRDRNSKNKLNLAAAFEDNYILSFLDALEVKEVDLEKDVRQILSLYHEGLKHYEDIIKEEREENGGSDLAIKIMDGVIEARELGIKYAIDKLKAQKGE